MLELGVVYICSRLQCFCTLMAWAGLCQSPPMLPAVAGLLPVCCHQGVLLCGLTSTQVQAVVVGPAHAGGHHLSSVLKFVALRDAARPSDVMALGGAWSKDVDGGDPARCAVRLMMVGGVAVQHVTHAPFP
jgi:hypothetical protein